MDKPSGHSRDSLAVVLLFLHLTAITWSGRHSVRAYNGSLHVPSSASALHAKPALTMVSPAAQISGKFNVDGSGNVDFKEEDGIDYAPVTVQMPGGERVPFLFTIKELQAKASVTPSSAVPQLCTPRNAAHARLKNMLLAEVECSCACTLLVEAA